MKLTYHGKVENGKLSLLPSGQRRIAKDLKNEFEGQAVTVTFTKRKKTRSLSQNAYYWAVVLPLLIEGFTDLGNAGLNPNNSEHVKWMHDEMKKLHLANGREVVDANGEVHTLAASSKDLSTVEFVEYIQNIQIWAADCLGIRIPDPQEQGVLPI